MENNWKEVKLGDYLDSISKTFKFTDKEVVFLNTSDILEGKVLNKEYVSPIGLPGQAKKSIQKGDLLFSEIRPANKRYARIDFDSEDYVVSTKLMVLRVKGDLDPIFLELYLTSEEILDYLQMIAEDRSGTFPQITFDIISKLELKLPPLPEQKAIASVLSSLDDKIDLLHQQNQTLEALAETLFRQWFIEEAKEDWPIYKFKDIVKHVKPGTNFQPKRVNNGIPFLNVKNLNNGFIDLQNNTFISQEEYERVHKNWKPEVGDVLISRIGTLGLVATILERDLPIAVHYNMINLKPKLIGTEFLYFFLKSNHFQEEYFSRARQSVQEYLAIEDVEEIEVKLPLEFEDFAIKEKQFIEFYNKIKNNFIQIQTLTQLRNTLLPKLMSGEVRVQL